jgi:hypothetical protein
MDAWLRRRLGIVAAVAVLFTLAESSPAESTKGRIVVLDLTISETLLAADPERSGELSAQIASCLCETCEVVPREDWRAAMASAGLDLREVFNSDNAAKKLAEKAGVRWVLIGRAGVVGGKIALNIKLFDAEKGASGRWAAEACDRMEDVPDVLRPLLEQVGILPPELDTDVAYFEHLGLAERVRLCRRKFADLGEDLARLKEAYDWFSARNQMDWAARCVAAVERHEPDGDWLNERRGRRDLREVYRGIPEDPLLLDCPGRALEKLVKMKEYAPRWGSPEEYEKARRLVGEVEIHLDKLRHDPTYQDVCAVERWVANHPVFGEYDYLSGSRGPYVVFVDHADTDAGEAGARVLLEQSLDALNRLYEEFRRVIGKRFELPPLEKVESASERLQKVFVFSDRESFDDYHDALDDCEPPPGASAYYRRLDQWVIVAAKAGSDDLEEDHVDDGFENRLLSAAGTQLFSVYRKIRMEELNGREVLWSSPELTCRAYWFEVGFGALLGSADWKESRCPRFCAPNACHLAMWKSTRDAGRKDWPLEDLLRPTDRSGMLLTAESLSDLSDLGRMERLFTAEAWAWCHFLWNGQSRKYRDEFLVYVGDELEGKSGASRFEKAIGGSGTPNWSRLAKSWQDHSSRLARKVCPR